MVLNICPYMAFPVSCLSTYRNVERGWFSHMSVPGFPSVMSSDLTQGEKGWVSTHVFLLSQNEKGA